MKRLIRYTFPVVLLTGIYFLGPQPEAPTFHPVLPQVPEAASALEQFVADKEARHNVKPGNEAEIIWDDPTKAKTPYAVLYLHGFSASKREGDPVHKQFAREFNCNLYLSRLSDHGIDTTETLLLFTADRVWESAKEALAIAKQLGEKIIIIGTSTGSTLALKLAATYPNDVHALIHLSPNVAINNDAAFLLNEPWGLYIARAVMGGKYRVSDAPEEHARYWNNQYRLESLTELQELIETTMTPETFKHVTQPSLTLYYYKDETWQDPEVKVSAMLTMHEQLGTPEDQKKAIAVPDARAHVIGSSMTSKDVQGVYAAMEKFAVEVLKLSR